jgi:DNA helicase TIP49 (TBP-interacting protein)
MGTRGRLSLPQLNKKGEIMKKLLLSIALAVVAPFAWGQVSETTTTTTTTDASGTITEYTPGSQIILKESSGPRTYRFGKTVTYVTRSGKVLDPDVVRTKIKVGVPVRVHYVGTGDSMMVDRVILDED